MKKRNEAQNCAAIAASGLFDADWYLCQYPDVARSGLDPLLHYVRFGEKEGRKPALDYRPEKMWDVWTSGNPLYGYPDLPPKGPEGTIPVVFATNEKYAPYLSVAIASLIANASLANDYTLYIFYNELADKTLDRLESQATSNAHIEPVWVGEYVREINRDARVSAHISVEAYYRILIPKLLGEYKKCIYLDCDIVLNEDIALLYAAGLDDNYLAGAEELWMSAGDRDYALALQEGHDGFYFNSGVLLINIPRFIDDKLFDKFISYTRNGVRYPTWDQDILNIITRKRKKRLDIGWNFQWVQFATNSYEHFSRKTFSSYAHNFASPYLIHYNSEYKPWNYNDGYFSYVFWEYSKLSPFSEEIEQKCIYMDAPTLEELAYRQFSGRERKHGQLNFSEGKYHSASNKTYQNDVYSVSQLLSDGRLILELEKGENKGNGKSDQPCSSKKQTSFPIIDLDQRGKQTVIFTHLSEPQGQSRTDSDPVPIVFASNEKYVPFVSVAIASLIRQANPALNYHVYIFYNEFSSEAIGKLSSQSTSNVRIEPICVKSHVAEMIKLYKHRAHFSVEVYFRALIPQILRDYKKFVYLDCDLIVNTDIAVLYTEDISDFLIGAVADFCLEEDYSKATKEKLQQFIPYYFNSGVLLMNGSRFNDENIYEYFMKFAANGIEYLNPDQDILNIICKERVKPLGIEWNTCWAPIMWKHYANAKADDLKKYMLALNKPAIIHYNGAIKPTQENDGVFAPIFWKNARFSPYYEELKQHCKYDLRGIAE